ncbi:MAG: PQQ-dependent sugar dehydrogenase [Pseudomonadota bacterium]
MKRSLEHLGTKRLKKRFLEPRSTRRPKISKLALAATIALAATVPAKAFEIKGTAGTKLVAETITRFNQPWALAFLPDGTMLVTTKPGELFHVKADGSRTQVSGMWPVAFGGQGGLGDVVPHPDFAQNQLLYISSAESLDGGSTFGAVVKRARLDTSGDTPTLTDIEQVWVQQPKMSGRGHYAHRIAFGPKGTAQEGKLFITSGDRQRQTPSQDFTSNLGKVIRLNDDGTVPPDNPIQDKGELAKTFWSLGHRNPLGIDFDASGRLWTNEMGPRHGDELNLTMAGDNYGWPVVSQGDQYSGREIPDHDTDPSFNAPEAWWVPSIGPSGLTIYQGDALPEFKGNALMGGLVARGVVRVQITGDTAKEVERLSWGKRIRDVEEGPDGALYVLEDRSNARLLRLTKSK